MGAETRRRIPTGSNEIPQGSPHPIAAVLKSFGEQVRSVNSTSLTLENSPGKQQDYLRNNLGFLAEGIEDIGAFSLAQQDLEEIWRTANSLDAALYFGYVLAGMIGCAYVVQGLENPGSYRGAVAEFSSVQNLKRFGLGGDEITIIRDRGDELHSLTSNMHGPDTSRLHTRYQELELDGDFESERTSLEEEIAKAQEARERIGDIREQFTNGFFMPMRIFTDSGLYSSGDDKVE